LRLSMSELVEQNEQISRFEKTYSEERKALLARVRKAGRSIEEAEDLVQDVYTEAFERLPLLREVLNLPAWLNSLISRRLIDAWRHRKVREAKGETHVPEEVIREIIKSSGLDPLDNYVRQNMVSALNDAIASLPKDQRKVIEAQVFGGMTFKEISRQTGESIDTLTARKRYAIQKLTKAMRHWFDS
jgi:RNA polymerase sigma factor (sigma-70 family)